MKKIILVIFLITFNLYAQWMPVKDIPENVNMPSIYVDYATNTIYAGADNVIYISKDGGNSWQKSSIINNDVDFVSSVVIHENKIYVGTFQYGVFVSSDKGNSWTAITNGLNGTGAKVITDLQIRGDSLYAATDGSGIFVMNLSSTVWQHFSNGLGSLISYNVGSLTLIDDIIYAGAGGNGSYYTNERGSNAWDVVNYGELAGVQLIFYDIVKIDSLMYISSSYGIYKSSDNGKTWSPEITNNGYIERASFAKVGNRMFSVLGKTSRSIWFEFDYSGEQWQWFDEQPLVLALNTGVFHNKLFVCSLNNLFYQEFSTTGIQKPEELTAIFELSQNYPNPFNPSTNINYSLKQDSNVRIDVYNALGELVSVLVNKYQNAGSYKIEYNGKNLTTGIYFYSISINNNLLKTIKMVLAK